MLEHSQSNDIFVDWEFLILLKYIMHKTAINAEGLVFSDRPVELSLLVL